MAAWHAEHEVVLAGLRLDPALAHAVVLVARELARDVPADPYLAPRSVLQLADPGNAGEPGPGGLVEREPQHVAAGLESGRLAGPLVSDPRGRGRRQLRGQRGSRSGREQHEGDRHKDALHRASAFFKR